MLVATLLAALALDVDAACAGCNHWTLFGGRTGLLRPDPCACVGFDGTVGVLSGAPYTFVSSYGDTCAAQDMTTRVCQPGGGSAGDDWCVDSWCYVDPNTCDKPTYKSSYFPGEDLWFSYQACDASFMGNTWVGFCECTGNDNLPNPDTNGYALDYGGTVTGTTTRGCASYDGREAYCQTGGGSAGADWCLDDWCYVDNTRCNVQAYASEFLPGSLLHFSYKACDASFVNNTFIAGTTPSNVPPMPAVMG